MSIQTTELKGVGKGTPKSRRFRNGVQNPTNVAPQESIMVNNVPCIEGFPFFVFEAPGTSLDRVVIDDVR